MTLRGIITLVILAVLFALGLIGYIAGSEKFARKDLPL